MAYLLLLYMLLTLSSWHIGMLVGDEEQRRAVVWQGSHCAMGRLQVVRM